MWSPPTPLARLSPLSRWPPNGARPDPPLPANRRGADEAPESSFVSRWSSPRPHLHRWPEQTSPQGRTGSCLPQILVLQRQKQTTSLFSRRALVLSLAGNLAITQLITGKARPASAFFPSKRKSLQYGNGLGKNDDSSAASDIMVLGGTSDQVAAQPQPQWSLMAGVVRLWNDWEVQILVLASFMLQVFLLMFARMRRRNISIIPRTLLWLAYLLADSIAIYILGHMSFYGKSHGHQQLMAFWAPFLLVHLGGQDNITAYSIEDSQLWLRHLLSFVVQTVGVAYVLYKYVAGSWTLVTAATLIFVAGVLKYGERVWALKSSSLENMISFLDSRKLSEAKREQRAQWGQGERLDHEEVLQGAHDLLPICMAQFVDYKFWPSQFQSKAVELFDNKGQMFELVEKQLSLMYDFLYTKAVVVFTWSGCSIRAISLVASITTSFLFQSSIGKNDFNRGDVIVTYILIAGAVLLEMTALLKAMGSTWTCTLLHAGRWHWLHRIIVSVRRRVKAAERNRRWSGSIGHPELLNSSHGSGGCVQSLRCKGLWKKLGQSLPVISDDTKKLVLEEVRRMVEACEGKEDIMRSYSGQCVLNPWHGIFKDPTSHAGIDFDDKILSWYFATKMFFSQSSNVEERDDVMEAVRAVSNYMIFLLAERPYMLPSPVRPGLYAYTEAAYVGLHFSDMEHLSRRRELDRRRRMWDLDTRRDGDELHGVRGKLDIIREDLDVIREHLVRKRNDLGTKRYNRAELYVAMEALDRSSAELNRRWEELDDLSLEVGTRRDKLEALDRRSEKLDKRREELDRRSKQPPTLARGTMLDDLEELNRRREELDKRRAEVDGRRNENLDVDLEELKRTMKKLEELDRRVHLGPPPSLVHGAELAVWLLEAEKARGKQEVRRVLLGVWVEMMCYAAHRCTRDSHAKQLNSGGEFITVVWLLSTAMFNRRYCDEDWFKNGVWEFFRPPFHVEEEHKDGCFCVIFYVCVLLPVLPYILYKYKEWSFPQFFRPSRGARPPPHRPASPNNV
ncbi:unnamed protein product [Triticum aestivum]|uniref:DUF4220 domain-containing protein n=1 Tax=Triticum aestivum TaxID=4565 RepID=A0A7H4LR27_WHEAT|nr:unnamed protein product [Triticum aestivum]